MVSTAPALPGSLARRYVRALCLIALVSFFHRVDTVARAEPAQSKARRLRSNLRARRQVYYTGKYWNDIPFVRQEVFHRRATGRPDVHWDSYLLERRGEAFQKALILNAGNGWVERSLADKNILLSGVGIDYLQEFVDSANQEARAKGYNLTYYQCNVNADPLPGGDYDLILNHAAAHHIARLDFVFQQILTLLLPNGWFVSIDYVGPHRNQYPAPLWGKLNELNAQIPAHLQQKLVYPHLPTMLATDASEAQHSEMILEVMRRYFFLELCRPLGGAIAYPLLTHNKAIHSKPYRTTHQVVEMLLEEDRKWLEEDSGRTFFAFVIATPLNGGLPNKAYQDSLLDFEVKREAAGPQACYYTTTAVAAEGCRSL